jgi:transcriptional regulator with XRE-family HTH domain
VESRKGIDCTPEIEEWRKQNPIRRWLDEKPRPRGARIKLLSEKLGVTKSALYRWMHGENLPDVQRMQATMTIVRSSITEYMRWWNRMPHEDTTPCVVQPQASESTPVRS